MNDNKVQALSDDELDAVSGGGKKEDDERAAAAIKAKMDKQIEEIEAAKNAPKQDGIPLLSTMFATGKSQYVQYVGYAPPGDLTPLG